MKHIILYTARNTKGKRDGDEFTREAAAYARYHTDRGDQCTALVIPLDLPAPRRPAAVEKLLLDAREAIGEPFDIFALFGHGTERWIQTSHTIDRLPSLAATLARILVPSPVLWWAACRTAGQKDPCGGILQRLVAGLLEHGVTATAWGHTTAGHTTRNPNLALITPNGITRVTSAERFTLQRELQREGSDLRFRIPLAESIPELLALAKK